MKQKIQTVLQSKTHKEALTIICVCAMTKLLPDKLETQGATTRLN